MEMSTENLRKVALLVASLDRDAADRLLDQLPADRAQAVRHAVFGLVHVDRGEQQSVIRDFLNEDSREHAESAIVAIPMPESTTRPARRRAAARSTLQATAPGEGEPETGARPIERASERLIAECLSDEMPQTIAVALAQLPTERASEVVAHLPATLQTQVLERLVELDPASSLDAPEIRDEFHHWLNEQISRSLHRAELAARLATILEATHSGTRQRILNNVSNSDARLAKELQHQLAVMSVAGQP
jgi:flagellar motor switch protein FliG